ncbi:hypothetical protein ABFS83_08G204200 [Erythranthe nasuta]
MEMQRGFSIREYASTMRSVDVANSWPFDEAAGEETVKSLLPPINVVKFTWWLDRLAESATDNNNNVVGMSENKKKTKAAPPKKRSIVEIFAAAPPVERAASEAEEEEEEGGSFLEEDASFIKWGPKGKRNDKRKKIISKKSDANAMFKKIKKLKPKHRGILRNHAKPFSKKNISHEGDKHVTFSDKNDTRSGKQSSNYHSECSNKLLRKDSSTAIIEDVSSVGIEKEKIDAGLFTTFIMKQKYDDEESVGRSESSDRRSTLLSMNRNLSESGRLAEVTHDSPMYACPNIDSTSRDLIRNLDPVIFPPPMSFKNNNESLVSRPNFSHANNSAFRFQTLPRQQPFCGNIHAKTGVNRLNNQDFVGLPLNSQGEFISFNPCANSSVDLFSERRRMDCGTYSTNRLNLFPDESYVIKQNPSRLDIPKSPCDDEANFGFDFLKINEHAFQDLDNNTVNKSLGDEKIQSTMRLMGKEFAVGGGRAFQESEYGHIWKDKKIVDEHRLGNIPVSNFMVQDHNYRETLLFRPSDNTHTAVFAARKIDSGQKIYPRSEYYNREFNLFSNTPKAAQNLPQLSAIRFPFMHPDIQGNTKSYSSQRSSSNRAPFRFDASRNVNRNYSFSHLRKSTNKVPFKPIKMPTFGFRNAGSSARFEGSVRNMGRAYQPRAATNRTTEFDNAAVGPIKLTAGAKHILKACQKKDKQFISSRFADSDISLSGTTTDFRFP